MRWKNILFVPIFLFVFVSCGASSTNSNAPQQMNTLQVNRDTGTINRYPPLKRTITNENAVQNLYKAALALPKGSRTGEGHSCPAAYDLVYHLLFHQNRVLVDAIDMYPSGCSYISINKNDVRPLSRQFIALFAQTIGIPQSQVDIQPDRQTTKKPLH